LLISGGQGKVGVAISLRYFLWESVKTFTFGSAKKSSGHHQIRSYGALLPPFFVFGFERTLL